MGVCVMARYFLNAFSIESGNAKKNDVNFAMDLVGRVDELLAAMEDGSLMEARLRQHCSY